MGFRGTDDQRNLTPLQRQILDAERSRRAKKKEEQREEMQSGNGGSPGNAQTPNARAGGASNSASQEETVRYINESENPDTDI